MTEPREVMFVAIVRATDLSPGDVTISVGFQGIQFGLIEQVEEVVNAEGVTTTLLRMLGSQPLVGLDPEHLCLVGLANFDETEEPTNEEGTTDDNEEATAVVDG